MKLPIAISLVAASLLSACNSAPPLPPNKPVALSNNETVVILGVVPSYLVSFRAGTIEGDEWSIDRFGTPVSRGFPENGYIVAKIPALKGAERYGLASIQPRGMAGRNFIPCRGNRVLTLEAPAKRVIYIGDIDYDLDLLTGNTLRYKYSSNPEKARQFLSANYPDLASKMEMLETKELLVAASDCEVQRPLAIYGAMILLPGQQRNENDSAGTYRCTTCK